MSDSVGIVILNYNGWHQTLLCLESVLKLDYPNYTVVVVDNASSNDSLEKILAWAKGAFKPAIDLPDRLAQLVNPVISKPLEFNLVSNSQNVKYQRLNILHSKQNLGFSGGNNLGVDFLLKQKGIDYLWLLNNDTIVDPSALTELLKKSENGRNQALIGSCLIDADPGFALQSLGGRINGITARTTAILNEKKLDYITFASVLIPLKLWQTIGSMAEDYFLYYEDCDYSQRALRLGYALKTATDSIVYHESGSSSSSALKDYYSLRNHLLLGWRFYRYTFPLVFIYVLLRWIKRAFQRDWSGFQAGFQGIRDFLGGQLGEWSIKAPQKK